MVVLPHAREQPSRLRSAGTAGATPDRAPQSPPSARSRPPQRFLVMSQTLPTVQCPFEAECVEAP